MSWDYYSRDDPEGSGTAFDSFKRQLKQLQDWRSEDYRDSMRKAILLHPLSIPLKLQEWSIYAKLYSTALQNWDVVSVIQGNTFPAPTIMARDQPVFGVAEDAKLLVEKQPTTIVRIGQSADLYCAIHAFNNLMGMRLLSPQMYATLLQTVESLSPPEQGALSTCETEALLLMARLLGVFLTEIIVARYEPYSPPIDDRGYLKQTAVRRFLSSVGGFILLLDSDAGKHYVAVLYGGILKLPNWKLAGKWLLLDSVGPSVSDAYTSPEEAVNSFVKSAIDLHRLGSNSITSVSMFVPVVPLLEKDGDVVVTPDDESKLSQAHARLLKAAAYIGRLELPFQHFSAIVRSSDPTDPELFGSGVRLAAVTATASAEALLQSATTDAWKAEAVSFVLAMLGASTVLQRMTASWFALIAYTFRSAVAGVGQSVFEAVVKNAGDIYDCMRMNTYPSECSDSILSLLETVRNVIGRRAVPLFYSAFLSSADALGLLREFSEAFLSSLSALVNHIHQQLPENRNLLLLSQQPEPIDPIEPTLMNEWISTHADVDGSIENILVRVSDEGGSSLYTEFMNWFVDEWYRKKFEAVDVESKTLLKDLLEMAGTQLSTILSTDIIVRPKNWNRQCILPAPTALDFLSAYNHRQRVNTLVAKQFYV